MRRIALCLYGLCLVLPMIGCKKEEPAPVTPPADGAAAPADGAAAPAEEAK
jgi:hypothetical protein